MKLTNYLSLPEPLVRAISADPYDKGDTDYSVSELITPPRIVALQRQHADELEEDAADRIWALVGQAIHEILRRADDTGAVTERRLMMTVDGVRVSGQLDRHDLTDGHICDYKISSMWSVMNRNGGPEKWVPKEEWIQQLQLYALLARANDLRAETAEVVVICRDWQASQQSRTKNYPPHQVVVLPVDLWQPDVALAFLRLRIEAHEAAKTKLPHCTREEQWTGKDGQPRRCPQYCPVSSFCSAVGDAQPFSY